MTLWQLELLRLVRTHRWLVLVGVYGFFGVTGPLLARYLQDLLGRFGGGIELVMPDPAPIDGLAQYVGDASQLGVLALVVVAATALAVDARPEAAAFYRTRIEASRTVLVPRYVVTTAAGVGAYLLGTLLAWGGSVALLGPLPPGRVLLGAGLGSLYLAVLVAVVALVASLARSVLATVVLTVGVALALPVMGLLPPLAPWLPSRLVGGAVDVAAGAAPGSYLRAALVALAAVPVLLATAAWRQDHREI